MQIGTNVPDEPTHLCRPIPTSMQRDFANCGIQPKKGCYTAKIRRLNVPDYCGKISQ
jgi:hypothetical protein